MSNRLDPIILEKKSEVHALYQHVENKPASLLAKLMRGEISISKRKNFVIAQPSNEVEQLQSPRRRESSQCLTRIFHGDSSRGAAQHDADKADEDGTRSRPLGSPLRGCLRQSIQRPPCRMYVSAGLYSTYRPSSNRSPTQSASGFRKPPQIHREICGLISNFIRSTEGGEQSQNFYEALQQPGLSIIAEVKRRSPSKGVLAEIEDPVTLAKNYQQGGAAALSILTDEKFFGGKLQDLIDVTSEISSLPALRKDFVIDPIQIAEAALAGASAILAIVAVLGKKTEMILARAHSLQLDVLVEVHDEEELKIALDAGATIIGINNRNLKTFEVDLQTAFHLVDNIPRTILKVAESGINTPELARDYHQAGFDAVLMGEALVRSEDPKNFIRECRCERYK